MIRWSDALNSRDDALVDQLVDELFAPNYFVHAPGMAADLAGREGLRQWAHGLIKNSSMIQGVTDEIIGEGDRLALRATVTITRAQSGTTVRFVLMSISRFVDGKIAEAWQLTGPRVEIAWRDPISVVKAMDAAVNAGDLAGVMAVFAENAVLTGPDGKLYTGKAAIQEWFQPQLNHIQVDSRNHQQAGESVTWQGTLTGERVRNMGFQVIEDNAAATVQNGLITSFSLTITSTQA
jgi:predicted SnoaL-like aldol condensation-catalyzing enzyme